MTHILTEKFLDKLKTYFSNVYNGESIIETRDFHSISSDDGEIRKESNFLLENKLIINAATHDPVTF